jgi:glutamate carboxypeptidase
VLLVGLLDTVDDPEGSFRELTAAPDGRTVTGPGAVDMKGGLLVAVTALEVLAESGVEIDWTVALNSDEETGSLQSMHVLRDIARQHDVGLVFEPALADGSLAVERMGSGQFKVEVAGRSAHVGREFERGVSAVTRLGELLVEIAALADPARGVIVNVGPLQGGSVTNAVPDYAAAWGNVRFRDAETGRGLAARLDAFATAPDALPRVTVHQVLNRPAKPETAGVRALAAAARESAEALGQTLPFAASGGVCDGNVLQDAGLPTLDTLGVRGGNLHRTDEFVEIASLPERAALLAVLLNRLAAGQVTLPARSM